MHTSVLISTLLGAGAIAYPQHKHAHLHEKKDVVFYSQWQDGPHTLVQEFIDEHNVIGDPPVAATTSSVVEVKANYALPPGGEHSWSHEAGKKYHPTAPITTALSSSSSPPALSSTTPPPVVVQASPIDSLPASSSATVKVEATLVDSTPSSTSSSAPVASGSDDTTTSTTSGACNPTDGEAWYSPPCTGSSSASALDKINNLRKTWNSSLADYDWSPGLAQNAHDTAWLATTWTAGVDSNGNAFETPNGEGRGWVMGHHLFNGSNGQCIAEGDNTKSNGNLTPIETMFLMWICEKPSSAIQDMCATIGSTGGDPNCYCANIEESCSCGHAMIIQDTGMNSIGCYFMNKVAEGKTDNAVNDLEKAQELGTSGNSAPGLLTCDFTG